MEIILTVIRRAAAVAKILKCWPCALDLHLWPFDL